MTEGSATERVAAILTADLMVRVRLEDAARAAGLRAVAATAAPSSAPDVLVADLDGAGALGAVRAWREAHPALRIVAFVSHVDASTWREAEALGCEVYPRGASASRGAAILGRTPT